MAIAAVAAALQAAYGGYQLIKAQEQMRKLQKQPMPTRMDAQAPMRENYELYKQQYLGGMGPGSLNLANQQFAVQQAGLLQTPASGQMRDVMGRVAAANRGQYATNLAAQNEQISRAGLAGMASANLGISGLTERDAVDRLQARRQQETAYAGAMESGVNNMFGALTGLGASRMAQEQNKDYMDMMRQYYGLNRQNPGQTPQTNISNPSAQVPVPVAGSMTPSTSFEGLMGRTAGMYPSGSSELSIGAPTLNTRSFPSLPSTDLMNGIGRYPGEEYNYDLGLPPLRTRYSTPRTTFR